MPRCRLGWHREFFKAARFQVKAARRGSAEIDRDQLRSLSRQRDLGYYLSFHEVEERLLDACADTDTCVKNPAAASKGQSKEVHG